MERITEHPHFFTATNLQWQPLLKTDKYKDIIIESLRFWVNAKRVKVYGFVIMSNHIHIIWQMRENIRAQDVQRDFLKFTAQKIKADLKINHPKVLELFRVNAKDRIFQLWERNALSVALETEYIFEQKLNYIHNNPVKAGICVLPEDYTYSSAAFYETGKGVWNFLTHYKE